MRRQMRRAQLASLHNKRVMDAGTGDVWDVRTTDVNEALCRRRYQVRAGGGARVRGGASPAAASAGLHCCTCHKLTVAEVCLLPVVDGPLPHSLTTAPLHRCRAALRTAAGVQGSLPHNPAAEAVLPLLPHRRDGHTGGGAAADHARAALPVILGPGGGNLCSHQVGAAAGGCLAGGLASNPTQHHSWHSSFCLHACFPAQLPIPHHRSSTRPLPPSPACPVCRHLPLARDLVRVARQRLVFRLDAYCKRDNKLFSDIIKSVVDKGSTLQAGRYGG